MVIKIESAKNILAFLNGSKLAQANDGTDGLLRQDRYSIRTASQWLGPALEDLVLAHQQIVIECNSTTDNPLMDANGIALHGGNFQAKAVTAAMEKTRQAMQTIGRMLFTQCTEIINPVTNRGLPPNLVAEDPSTSSVFKGPDIQLAALQAELGFLAGPVNHVQSAEMGNQALNSLALISARYTHIAINVLSELAAVHLVALCQALDLRAMHIQFLAAYRSTFSAVLAAAFSSHNFPLSTAMSDSEDLESFLWTHLLAAFSTTTSMDASARFPAIVKTLCSHLATHSSFRIIAHPYKALDAFAEALLPSLMDSWCAHRDAYLMHGDANSTIASSSGSLLGKASRRVYDFIRRDLGVPILCRETTRTPHPEETSRATVNGHKTGIENGTDTGHLEREPQRAPTVGSYTSTVHRAIRDGTMMNVIMEILAQEQGLEYCSENNEIERLRPKEEQSNSTGTLANDETEASTATTVIAGEVAASETVADKVVASKVVASEMATDAAAAFG